MAVSAKRPIVADLGAAFARAEILFEEVVAARLRGASAGRASAHRQSWSLEAVPGSAAAARGALGQHLARRGLAPGLCDAIALCVSEAVTNAVVHGGCNRPVGACVELEVFEAEGVLCVFVRDRGPGPIADAGSPGLGVGLPLMATLADHFDISARDTGGTEVALRFRLERER